MAPQMTKALFFHNGALGAPLPARVVVNDTFMPVETQLKYLGLILESGALAVTSTAWVRELREWRQF